MSDPETGPIPWIYRRMADRIDHFAPAEGPPPRSLWPFMRWSLAGSGGEMKLALLASASVGVSTVVLYALIGWLIDTAQDVGPGYWQSHGMQFAIFVLFSVVVWPLTLVANAAFNSVTLGPNLFALVISRINRHTLGQSLSYFDNDFAGRIAQKAQQTARAVTDVVLESTNMVGNVLTAIIASSIMLAAIDPILGIFIVLWASAYGGLLRYFIPKIRSKSQLRAARRAVVTGQIVDAITNIATVKLFAHGHSEEEATKDALHRYREAGVAWAGIVVTLRLAVFVVAGLLPVGLIGLSLWLWGRGAATAGDVAAAGLVATRLSNMTGWVSFTALGIFTNVGEIEDGIRTLSPSHTILDRDGAVEPPRSQGEIRFEGINFAYGGETAALNDLNLTIRPGEKVALVGQSGAGKSTILSLLLRLYDVEEGCVRLDGTDIRDLTQDGLRRQIAVVRQETSMFNRPVRENILYGRPEASEEELIEAARQAEALEFIHALKDNRGRVGFEAFLGERGVKLSGGQRQRIALARAILKDAPVLVLDEATSALDSEVEALIQTALERVMEGKTVIAIAHRLSTIARMDRIIVLDQGRIVEEGTHDELLDKGGLYARFWQRQSGGFLRLEAAE